ncbi:MAG: response regulator [Dysgonamonadaceae bacterium]|nr:response regulator [Dysgonamonadaceae bacterium]MDD3899996.1 response regulator [Dysgonamonadaceae bacterium]MDD4398746.1 response regulator [Dysgonamonadaceae bacterium]
MKSGYIIFLFLILILIISYSIVIYQLVKVKRKYKFLLEIEKRQTETFKFLTHEFRAPLTVIIGLIKQLKKKEHLSQHTYETYLNMIDQQGRNLTYLTNQLSDVLVVKNSINEVEWKTGNLVVYLEMIAETFHVYAAQKGIDLVFFSKESQIETDFVPSYINKILYNLLFNAIKYSNSGDKISLVIEKSDKVKESVLIKIIDQGKGIDSSAISHIFDLYYKDNSNGKKPGSGIGLALTKQLVEILDGKINVESKLGVGSKFTIELPIVHNEKKLFSYWLPIKKPADIKSEIYDPLSEEDNSLPAVEINENDPRDILLIAEDNKDVAYYIKELFSNDEYKVLHARNGDEAMTLANKYIPDVVITDVLMPGKNGMQLCAEIKSSELLNHIPIIMLTALSSESDALDGFKCGADVFLRKPFNSDELQVQVKKLVSNKKLLKDKFNRTVVKNEVIKNTQVSSQDSGFLQRVNDIIYREMKNPDFKVTNLANDLAISTSQLNKKINDMTGYASSIYILQIKLSYAKKILSTYDKSIGEVASDCGIYDVNYFSRVFKKYMGLTPSQYKHSIQNNIK